MSEDARTPDSAFMTWALILLAGALTVGLWQVPWGPTLLWPFTLLATWVHEMGHGMMAALLTRFDRLEVYEDGGGVAFTAGTVDPSWQNAAIAAAGLLGPAVAGATFILFGRKTRNARVLLGMLGVAMVASVVVYVRNAFGIGVVSAWGLALIGLAAYGHDKLCFFAVQLLGIQFCVNTFKDFDYMFSEGFQRNGAFVYSDSAQVANNLGVLPYWGWGGAVAAASVLLLLGSLSWTWSSSPPRLNSQPLEDE